LEYTFHALLQIFSLVYCQFSVADLDEECKADDFLKEKVLGEVTLWTAEMGKCANPEHSSSQRCLENGGGKHYKVRISMLLSFFLQKHAYVTCFFFIKARTGSL
jgi:hypothetical protein